MHIDRVIQLIEHKTLHKNALCYEIYHYRVLFSSSALLNMLNDSVSTLIRAATGRGFYHDNVGMVTCYRC